MSKITSLLATPDSLVGYLLGDDYHLVEVLGVGGMAWVYKARDTREEGRFVAIKILRPELAAKQELYRRFLREAQLQASLMHPHIVQVYEVQQASEVVFLVMEYIQGETLRGLMNRLPPPYAPEVVIGLATPMFRAVEHAHQQKMIHRDIKPDNFMVDWSQGAPVLKATDFGLAKVLGESGVNETKTGMMMGTVSFISPEQATDTKRVDTRADIYSLGVCMYELATGHLPFTGSFNQILLRVMSEQPQHPCEVRPECPRELAEIILTCMRKEPQERFGSCGEVLERLHQLHKPPEGPALALDLPGLGPPVKNTSKASTQDTVDLRGQVPLGELSWGKGSLADTLSAALGGRVGVLKALVVVIAMLLMAVIGVGLRLWGGGAPAVHPRAACQAGETRACYSGPPATRGKGPCRAGVQRCMRGAWAPCQGQIQPAQELCNGKDDDCDGKIDNGPTLSKLGQRCVLSKQGACTFYGRYGCAANQAGLRCRRDPGLPAPHTLRLKLQPPKRSLMITWRAEMYNATGAFCLERPDKGAKKQMATFVLRRHHLCKINLHHSSWAWRHKQLTLRLKSLNELDDGACLHRR